MVEPTLLISIDCAGMVDTTDVNFSGTPASGELGITDYTEPAMLARVRYAAPSDYQHGDEALGWTWQQSILSWDFTTDESATEQESRLLIERVRLAVARLEFNVTVTVNGADAETWLCNAGSLTPAGSRKYADLVGHYPVWQLSLPAYPVRGIA